MSTIDTTGIKPSEWDGSQNDGNLSTDNFRDNIQAIKDALDEIPAETGNLTDAEVQQLQNINAVTISNSQWGYLGGQDQAVATTDAVTFDSVSAATLDTGQGANELYAMDQAVRTTDAVTFASVAAATLDTGQGANELYPMDQAVRTTDAVTFATLNTGQGANELYPMDQAVQTTDAVTFATVNTGQGANELYAMDQAVQTTDDVTFNTVDTSEILSAINAATSWVNFDGTGTVSIREDYNVDSLTDNGTGNYDVNFTSSLPSGDYAVGGCANDGTTNPVVVAPASPSTASFTVFTRDFTDSPSDADTVSVFTYSQ